MYIYIMVYHCDAYPWIFSDDIQDVMYPEVAADEDPGLHREARDSNPCNYRISDSGNSEY